MADQSIVDSYNQKYLPLLFDLLIHGLFLPFGGISKVRRQALDFAGVTRGDRVLELGCGTGGVTRLMVRRGAGVTSVDGSWNMIARAKTKNPDVEFRIANLPYLSEDEQFDCIVFGFVLHELDQQERRDTLANCLKMLTQTGRILIVDHDVPQNASLARWWKRLLLSFEPETARDCIERGYSADIDAAGLCITDRSSLASGTVQCLSCGVKTGV